MKALGADVPVEQLQLERFSSVLPAPRWRQVEAAAARARDVLAGRIVWNVNSTARGGGVAEMLQSLLGYARGAGVDARWRTVGAEADFFRLTKRLHNQLHGADSAPRPLAAADHELYRRSLGQCAEKLIPLISAEDLVILHDPQTAGLVSHLRDTGARIAWRSHIGSDRPTASSLDAWRFLLPYVQRADCAIFSRRDYYWGGLELDRLEFIHPSIDAFSAKNRALSEEQVRSILIAAGIVEGPAASAAEAPVTRTAQLFEDSRLSEDTPVVLQVSRWDRLKDPVGVIDGFLTGAGDAHLLLAGPEVAAVSDDPEGAEVAAEVLTHWRALSRAPRERVHLAMLPMEDLTENALIVNALQRHARVVCQKSLAEGFGLTVAEAMWKQRPVVASRVGGIQDQIVDGVDGLLLDDPRDAHGFGALVQGLLEDGRHARSLAANARGRAVREFLGPEHLMRYLALFERMLRRPPHS